MKRYDHVCSYDGGGPAEPHEAVDGEWVRHDEAEAAIAFAVAAMRERCARIVREAASVHGLCCSDCDALADLVAGLGSKK
jgi:hypothetical protein